MQLPLLLPAMGWALGLATAGPFLSSALSPWVGAAFGLVLLVVAAGVLLRRWPLRWLALSAAAALGWAWGRQQAPPTVSAGRIATQATVLERASPTRYGVMSVAQLDSPALTVTLFADSGAPSRSNRHALDPGARLRLCGRLRPLADSLPEGYRRSLEARGISATLRVYELQALDEAGPFHLRLRAAGLDRFDRLPHHSAAALGRALLLGDRSGLDADARRRFARSGAAHVLAISGAHLMLLLGALAWLLPRLRANRFGPHRLLWAALLSVVLIGYGAVAGGSPAVLRAVVMAVLALVGQALFRPVVGLNLLAATALLLTAVHPPILYDLGFQLSVAAVAGILLLAPAGDHWLMRMGWTSMHPLARQARSLLVATVAATLFTAPVLWAAFAQLPTWFLVSNALLVPIASVATLVGFVYLPLADVPLLGSAIGWALDALLLALDAATAWCAALPGAVLTLPPLGGCWAALLLAGLTAFGLLLHHRSAPGDSRWV